MTKNKALEALSQQGQSIWYDNLSRAVLSSGELKTMVASGVTGLTSNPTIFKKAIADSADYDSDIASLAKKGKSAEEICEILMVGDVGGAADLLRGTFDSSKGVDGYASIEVSPFLAADAKGTLVAARRIWASLARPNIMIKVPATAECIPVIQELLADGINVNITLIFSVETYSKVLDAYVAALESRKAAGKEISGIASVASFFVSRVDALCEKKIDGLIKSQKATPADLDAIFGKIGVANSRLAYHHFEDVCQGKRWAPLVGAGARVQRPLWASTGTKNPTLDPLLYVKELVAKNTVNTVPPDTLATLMKFTGPLPAPGMDRPTSQKLVAHIDRVGLSLSALLGELRDVGVKSFADSYRELLDSVETKRKRFSVA